MGRTTDDLGTTVDSFLQNPLMLVIMRRSLYLKSFFSIVLVSISFEILFYAFEDLIPYFFNSLFPYFLL